MTEVAPPDVKRRRRLSAADGDPKGVTCLSDLPTGILAHAASFLAAPSKALFAVALGENSAVTPNERSSAIVGHQCDVLDFGVIGKELANKLSDTDVKRVLLCIDAVGKLKRLKLTNCTKIRGTCLEPLRGSLIIEQIDLSLVGNQNSDLEIEASISCEHVLPILGSIIERQFCELKHLQFPYVWRKEPSTDSEFHAFIGWYNRIGTVSCSECNRVLPSEGEEWIETDTEDYYHYGTHWYTCYGCLKYYCYCCDTDDEDDEEEYVMKECDTCRRDYCKSCSEMANCSGCSQYICNDCCKYKCVECDEEFCSKCVQNGKNVNKCEYCDKCYCHECNEDVIHIYTCGGRCDVRCCDDCRLNRYRQGQQDCTGCIKQIASLLVGENLGRKQLQDENKQLNIEMEELKRQIEELKLENKELRSKLT